MNTFDEMKQVDKEIADAIAAEADRQKGRQRELV